MNYKHEITMQLEASFALHARYLFDSTGLPFSSFITVLSANLFLSF